MSKHFISDIDKALDCLTVCRQLAGTLNKHQKVMKVRIRLKKKRVTFSSSLQLNMTCVQYILRRRRVNMST